MFQERFGAAAAAARRARAAAEAEAAEGFATLLRELRVGPGSRCAGEVGGWEVWGKRAGFVGSRVPRVLETHTGVLPTGHRHLLCSMPYTKPCPVLTPRSPRLTSLGTLL